MIPDLLLDKGGINIFWIDQHDLAEWGISGFFSVDIWDIYIFSDWRQVQPYLEMFLEYLQQCISKYLGNLVSLLRGLDQTAWIGKMRNRFSLRGNIGKQEGKLKRCSTSWKKARPPLFERKSSGTVSFYLGVLWTKMCSGQMGVRTLETSMLWSLWWLGVHSLLSARLHHIKFRGIELDAE